MQVNSPGEVDSRRPMVVLGGTGKTGRRVVERLRARGWPVRVGSRRATPSFHWDRPDDWCAVLDGAEAAYISYHPDLAAPGAAEAVAALTKCAVRLGVRRLVLLSGRGEVNAQLAEQALEAEAAEWTVLRCSWFMQNFSESLFLDSIVAGELALPVGAVSEPFLDVEDIADCAVAAMEPESHRPGLLELTGPRSLSFSEATDAIAHACGRPIHFRQISLCSYADRLRALAYPEDLIEFLEYLFAEVLDGRNARVTHGVEAAIGRAAGEFVDYAKRAAASGAWSPKARAAVA